MSWLRFLWLLGLFAHLVSATTQTSKGSEEINADDRGICDTIICKSGRECKVLDNRIPTCVCVETCPDHHKPVCGSNGVSYESHCLLHRDACIRSSHISIKHDGYCKKGKNHKKKTEDHEKPIVCFQNERDLMRQLIIDWLQTKVEEEGWFSSGKSYKTVIEEIFQLCDADHDELLDATEFMECVKNNKTAFHVRDGDNADLVSALCIDAIIESMDTDSDWLLNLKEFESCMDPDHVPAKKRCSLEGKDYNDGSETAVDCNNCVCACGNWVCTSSACNDDEDDSYDDNQTMKKEEWDKFLEDLNINNDKST
ncbi:follistatin-related protein 1-like isoform X1 [Tachypleus tridentatus]|uniref:follistatin-related protein 1-like isoform X1 n=1 Tax=Tachypleus tridentatus TaxID=6853 RepID=UPI003FD329A5